MPVPTSTPPTWHASASRDGAEVKLISAERIGRACRSIADDSVQRGTIWAPFNQAGADITDLVDAGTPP